jgi:glutamine cyclotransferase
VLPSKRFIEGLEFINSTHMLMSSGLTGNSHLDIINIETMQIERTIAIEAKHFGEGITILKDTIYMLTYLTRALFKFDMDLKLQSTLTIPKEIREGWGMTHDGESLIVSDGSNKIFYVDPETIKVTKTITVKDTWNINELELVGDFFFANQFMTSDILVISLDGELVHRIDMTELLKNEQEYLQRTNSVWNANEIGNNVLNGIAYHAQTGSYFITGKNWHFLTQVKFLI